MYMNETLFMVMDIPAEVKKLITKTFDNSTCDGMTESEFQAYQMGVYNTLSALQHILSSEEDVVAHMFNIDPPTEMDVREITQMIMEDDYE